MARADHDVGTSPTSADHPRQQIIGLRDDHISRSSHQQITRLDPATHLVSLTGFYLYRYLILYMFTLPRKLANTAHQHGNTLAPAAAATATTATCNYMQPQYKQKNTNQLLAPTTSKHLWTFRQLEQRLWAQLGCDDGRWCYMARRHRQHVEVVLGSKSPVW